MNLCLSSLVLVAGLFLSTSALTPEECEPLVKPLSLADHSMLLSRVNFIMGYTDSEAYNAILRSVESSWMDITQLRSGEKELHMHQENKINGTCFASKANVTIDDDHRATSRVGNITTVLQLLPTCDDCVVFFGNSTARNLDKFLKLVNVDHTIKEEEITTLALYLMAKQPTVKDADIEHFKKQASCLGFNGEPEFHYDSKKGFCEEGKSVLLELKN